MSGGERRVRRKNAGWASRPDPASDLAQRAEGEGFEPSIRLTTDNGFRDVTSLAQPCASAAGAGHSAGQLTRRYGTACAALLSQLCVVVAYPGADAVTAISPEATSSPAPGQYFSKTAMSASRSGVEMSATSIGGCAVMSMSRVWTLLPNPRSASHFAASNRSAVRACSSLMTKTCKRRSLRHHHPRARVPAGSDP